MWDGWLHQCRVNPPWSVHPPTAAGHLMMGTAPSTRGVTEADTRLTRLRVAVFLGSPPIADFYDILPLGHIVDLCAMALHVATQIVHRWISISAGHICHRSRAYATYAALRCLRISTLPCTVVCMASSPDTPCVVASGSVFHPRR
jgi:hypothetical protein